MRIERRPVDGVIACAAGPCCVAAAVSEAGLMTDQDFTGSELVPVGASRRRVGDPLAVHGQDVPEWGQYRIVVRATHQMRLQEVVPS